MYNFCGVKVTHKRFWELSEVAQDLLILEKELDKEEGRIIDESLVQELINIKLIENQLFDKEKNELFGKKTSKLFVKKTSKLFDNGTNKLDNFEGNKLINLELLDNEIDQTLDLKEKSNHLNCSNCGSRLVLKKSKWGSFLACSNICDCERIEVLG
jgi:hypothetical protein